jgi:ParB-like chromosome segregation protein Spo0J
MKQKGWRRFDADEEARLRELAAVASHSEICRAMGRSRASVRNKLRRLGLARTEDLRRELHARAYRR